MSSVKSHAKRVLRKKKRSLKKAPQRSNAKEELIKIKREFMNTEIKIMVTK